MIKAGLMSGFELIVEPRLSVGCAQLGPARIIMLQVQHPRHGDLNFIVNSETAANMANALLQTIAQVEKPENVN